jgi:type IV pilus assembly protein PilV
MNPLKEKGFTLIELLIGILILAIGLLALAHMQVAALNGNYSANCMTVATVLAQDQIERLKILPFNDPALEDTNPDNNNSLSNPTDADSLEHNDPNNPIDERGETAGLRRYQRFWNIADNTPIQGAKTVVVFVYWGAIEANGLPRHRVAIPTIIGQ